MGKIYADDISRISAKNFNKIGKIRLKDGTVLKTGKEIKDFAQKIARGGVLESAFKRRLKSQGIALNQEGKRDMLEKKVFGAGEKLEEVKEKKNLVKLEELRKKQNLKAQMQRDAPDIETGEREYKISAGVIGQGATPSPKTKDQGGFAGSAGKGPGFAGSSSGAGNKPTIPFQR